MMKFFKVVPTVFCAALLSATFAPTANADDWNKKTTMTFSAPIEIPGVHLQGWGVLPAGTYVFKLLDSKSDRHIVQIFNADETVVYATILAIPNYRLQATDKTVITFNEGIQGRPEALRAWFYPGKNWGEEFVYPKAKAMELAAATKTPVLFTALDIPLEVVAPIKSVDEPVVVQLRQAPILAVQPTGEQVQLAVVVTPPPPTELAIIETAPTPAPAESLPDTASSLPLIALLGMLSLGGALAVRSMRNRTI
jgi:hypothetical protein